ncbi:MAG: serine hydrolase domain-containing protein [Longimicrobiaceae bacterium]
MKHGGTWTAVLAAALAATAAPAQEALPDGVARQVDRVFAAVDRPGSPGCAVGVYRRGVLAYARGYGSANLELGVPNGPATSFYLSSTAKQFTAASVWLLALQGRLRLDAPVRTYLPELPDYGTPITLRHLLHHTSGLRDYIDLQQLGGHPPEEVSTSEAAVRLVLRQRGLNFAPGSRFQYANSNYLLLSEVVRKVTGQALPDFARARFFEPLGMRSTAFVADPRALVPGRASGYAPRDGGTFENAFAHAVRIGPGGAYSTVEDLARWDANFYTGAVGGRALVDSLVVPGRLSNGRVLEYASGLMLGTFRGLPTVSHSGNSGVYRSELIRFPTEETSVAVLCNVGAPQAPQLAEQVAAVVLAGRLQPERPAAAPPPPPSVPPAGLAADTGHFWNPSSAEVRRLRLRTGQMLYDIDAWSRARLTPLGGGRYRFGPNEVRVSGARPARRLVVSWADGRRETYREFVPPNGQAPLPGQTGCYRSAELEVEYRLAARGESLVLARPNQEERILAPVTRDVYSEGTVRLRFTRDARGRVAGFTFGEGDVDGIGFRAWPCFDGEGTR